MTQILKSLDEITTGYNVFEKDQVLTATQLNSIARYFEDQTRLTRTELLGVGIVCGLRITSSGKQIMVSKGMGVTTDGDLLWFAADRVFSQFKLYDTKNPVYDPFYTEGAMIPIFELIPADTTDKRAFPLSLFTEQTDHGLDDMLVLFYMESYINNPDLCAGTDCDQQGQEMVNNEKILLVSRGYLSQLKPQIPEPKQAYAAFDEIVADRPEINSGIKTHAQLVVQYRNTCSLINRKLFEQLPKIYPACSFFLGDIYSADPVKIWLPRLEKMSGLFAQTETGIQYYYDFLRDLVETYNEFHELLFDDTTWCSPDKNAFPKHLILGTLNLDPVADPDRTGLYPSHLTSHTLEKRDHARFLAKKLTTLIVAFSPPAADLKSDIRITPGMSEEHCPETRAIPYYYKIDKLTPPIQASWNYQLHRKGKDAWNYSYNAGLYNAQGAAADPAAYQIGKFDFFRIEGFLGQNIVTVHKFLENQISTKNLPINLRSVMLGEDKRKIIIRPPFVFNDIYRFHNQLRQDLINQLDEVKRFSSGLKTKVTSSLELLDPVDRGTFTQVAEGRNNELSVAVDRASAKLSGSYADYASKNTAAGDTWQTHVSTAMEKAGTFKEQLSIAAKTEFVTPFDSLISNRHIDLLGHLDDLILWHNDIILNKLLFNNYIALHPGLEHCGGVMRGGTFVLVYDENNLIIADFMLPYQETDAEKNDQLEPVTGLKPFRPGYVIDHGLNMRIPVDRNILGKIDEFKSTALDGLLNAKAEVIRAGLDKDWNVRFNDQQKDYFSTIKESFGTMSNALIKRISGDNLLAGADLNFRDTVMGNAVKDVQAKRAVLASYQAKVAQTTDPAQKQRYADMAGMVEDDLAATISDATQHIADTGTDVSLETEGFSAMMEINNGLSALSNKDLLNKTTANLIRLAGTAKQPSFRLIITNIAKR